METSVETVSSALRGIFGYVLYPVLIIGVFGFISIVIAQFVLAVSGERRIRRLVAAALPFTVIVFALVPSEGDSTGFQDIFEFAEPWLRFVIGGLLGVATKR